MIDPACVFCKIAAGKTTAKVIEQNERAIAFLDAFPLAKGHTLVISRSHHAKIQDMDTMEAAAMFEMTRRVVSAVEAGTKTNASTIAIHNGREAGQEIPHVHVHIIPRTVDDGAGPVHSMFRKRPKIGSEEMDSICSKIVAGLS